MDGYGVNQPCEWKGLFARAPVLGLCFFVSYDSDADAAAFGGDERRAQGATVPPDPRSLGQAVVGCKIPWKENSLISRGIGDFSIYPARARLFSGKPG